MHTYLANKLRNEIAQVPTAADRLVLSYNAGYFNNTQPSATNTKILTLSHQRLIIQ